MIRANQRPANQTPVPKVVRQFASGSVASLIGSATSQALPLAAAALLARVLDPDSYGVYMFLYSTAAMLASLTGYGPGLTATRFVALLASDQPSRAAGVITRLLGFTVKLALVIAAFGIVVSLLDDDPKHRYLTATAPISATAALYVTISVAAVQAGILGGLHRFQDIAYGSVFRLLFGIPIAVWGGVRWPVTGAIGGIAAASALGCLLNHKQILRACEHRQIDLTNPASDDISLWSGFSLPSFLAYALVTPVLWIAQAILLKAPDGLHQVAIFNIGVHWRNVILFVPAALVQAATPLMTELLGKRDSLNSARIFTFNIACGGIVAILCGTAVSLLSRVILSAYGETYADHWLVLVVSAFAAVLAAINNAVGILFVAADRMWAGFVMNGCWAVTLLVQAVPVTQRWGALGLSAAVLMAYALHTLWQSGYVLLNRASLVSGRHTPDGY